MNLRGQSISTQVRHTESDPLKVERMASLGLCRGDMLAWLLCPQVCVSLPVPFILP